LRNFSRDVGGRMARMRRRELCHEHSRHRSSP
jgi:hypothetical protein